MWSRNRKKFPEKQLRSLFILLNDFTCRETRLHNADWFNRMITLGSIQRYAVYIPLLTAAMCCIILYLSKQYS